MGPKRNIFEFVFIFSYVYIYKCNIYSQGLESKYKRERCVFLGVEDVLRDKNGCVTRKKTTEIHLAEFWGVAKV